MRLTTNLKLYVTLEQHQSLLKTMRMFNQVCNEISKIAFDSKEFRQYNLHKLCYHKVKNQYPDFSSQLIIRAIDTVAASYKIKRNPKRPNGFKKYSAVVYDDRVIDIKGDTVSLWTIDGRMKKIQTKRWNDYKLVGQKDLNYRNGKWILSCGYDKEPVEKNKSNNYIGIDLGVNKIAVDSDGIIYHNETIEKKRKQYLEHRRRLQLRNTRSSKYRIKKSGNKESKFRKDVNHCISKTLVQKAKSTNAKIILENLKHINSRTMVRKSERMKRLSWSFNQLRSFTDYKASLAGVEVILVDSHYTSQRCHECGCIDKKNRKTQEVFCCIRCGHYNNADVNAAKNIQSLGDQSTFLLFESDGNLSDSSNKLTNLFVSS